MSAERGKNFSTFAPGLTLNQQYYEAVVQPILAEHFWSLRYAAALIGSGSDVLGFDAARPRDHEWGPRLLLFLDDPDFESVRLALDEQLREALPPPFRGYSTAFSAKDPSGVRVRVEATASKIAHHVDFSTTHTFLTTHLGWSMSAPPAPSTGCLSATKGCSRSRRVRSFMMHWAA